MAQCFEEDRSLQVDELNSLHSNIEHIKTIVSMQQGYSRSGGTETVVGIAELIEQSIRINESSLQKAKIEIVREYDDVPDLTTDRHYVIQILVNLITNAKNMTPIQEFIPPIHRNQPSFFLRKSNSTWSLPILAYSSFSSASDSWACWPDRLLI